MAEQSRRLVSLDKPIDKFHTLSKTRRDVSLLTESLNKVKAEERGNPAKRA